MSGQEKNPFNATEARELEAVVTMEKEKAKEKKDHESQRQWQTMGKVEKPTDVLRKVSLDIGIYKAYAGCLLEDDSDEEDQNLDNYVAAIEYKGQTRVSQIARFTTAGVNSYGKTYFFLVKAFLGSGMLTLPMGFTNGGVVFCIACMAVICAVSIMGMTTLLEARTKVGGSYSDLAEASTNRVGRVIVDISLALCQVILNLNGRLATALSI